MSAVMAKQILSNCHLLPKPCAPELDLQERSIIHTSIDWQLILTVGNENQAPFLSLAQHPKDVLRHP
jgi:hypothetical protein